MMKDSGIEWIGEIPENWGTIKNKYSSYIKGRIGWQGLKTDEFIEEGPHLVTGTDFINGLVNWESCVHITKEYLLDGAALAAWMSILLFCIIFYFSYSTNVSWLLIRLYFISTRSSTL